MTRNLSIQDVTFDSLDQFFLRKRSFKYVEKKNVNLRINMRLFWPFVLNFSGFDYFGRLGNKYLLLICSVFYLNDSLK